MKSIILVCLLFAVAFSANCPTYTYKCAARGGACITTVDVGTNAYAITGCSYDELCGSTTTSNNGNVSTTTGTCYPLLKEGVACDDTNAKTCDEDAGLFCPATGTRVCTKNIYNIASGAACDSDAGKYCINDNYCGAGSVCTPLKTSGQDCTTNLCTVGYTCGQNSKCVAYFSVAEGGACRAANTQGGECDAGLYCDATSNTCKKPTASSLATCNTTTPVCPNAGETCTASCSCSNGVTTCKCELANAAVSSCFKSAAKSYFSCASSNKKCVGDLESCGRSCFKHTCEAAECDADDTDSDAPTCNNSKCGDASSVAISAVLLVAALFIAM